MTAKIYHADLWGTRAHKYATLAEQTMATVPWAEITPTAPNYLFVPQEEVLREEYEKFKSVKEIFQANSLGLNSHRDDFAVAFDVGTLNGRVADMTSAHLSDSAIQVKYGLADTGDFQLDRARNSLRNNATLLPCLYRPFDFRTILFNSAVLDRPRLELNRHFIAGHNIGLVTTRQTREPFAVLATDRVCGQHKIVSVYDGSYIFPLYIYPTEQEKQFGIERHANLAPDFVKELTERLGHEATPKDTFHYLYAVLHSPTYRERYGDFLKRDFPRIPLPPDAATFADGAAVGNKLVAAHLLEDPALLSHAPGFPHGGPNTVDKMSADKRYAGSRVHLNAAQHFDGVSPEVWQFRVGGYQPAAKWLDDRAGRTLSDDDLSHYRRLLAALKQTLTLLPAADAVFARVLAAVSG